MRTVSEVIAGSTVIYIVLAVMNAAFITAGCAFALASVFRISPKKKPLLYIIAAVLTAAVGVLRPWAFTTTITFDNIWSTLTLVVPYIAVGMLFRLKDFWKCAVTVTGYTIVEAVKYLILIAFFRYDNEHVNDPVELTVEIVVNGIFFFAALGFFFLYASKHDLPLAVTRISPWLFVLSMATLAVFVASLALLNTSIRAQRNAVIAFVMLNIPLLAGTIAYAVAFFIKAKASEENYKKQLDMQVRYYETMEQVNEDLRIFRHDFPKKMRPLVAYLEENRAEDAKAIAEELGGFVANAGRRFNTGNYRLDTVLYCEQQAAAADGIEIEFPFGGAFPAEGIDPDDVYTIFPNALDNAIEACRKVDGPRKITVHSRVVDDTVFVTISNPVAGSVTEKNGLPQSDKADRKNHGYGFRSMKKAAAKYGADNLDFTVKDGVFTLRISLKFR